MLLQAQFLARFDTVGWVQHFGDGFVFDFVFQGVDVSAFVEDVDVKLFVAFGREQTQVVDRFAVVADHRKVKRNAVDVGGVFPDEHRFSVSGILGFHLAVHGDGNAPVGAGKLPGRVFAFPAVGHFYLIAVFKFLFEQAVFIVDAVTETGNAERGHRIQVTGGQPSEPAVAERRIVFGVKDFFQRFPRPAVDLDVF